MAEEMTSVPQPYPLVAPPAPPEVSAWQQLGQSTRRTRPVTVARYALVIGALAALVWLANTAWQSLVPFVVGGFIAYAVLPLVNRLDRIMPRWFASLVVVVGVLAFIALFIATLVPLIAAASARVDQQPADGRSSFSKVPRRSINRSALARAAARGDSPDA